MSAAQDPPPEAAALFGAAQGAARSGQADEAARLLADCLAAAPELTTARQDYAMTLRRLGLPTQAMAQIDILLAEDPGNAAYAEFRAGTRALLGDHAGARADYEAILATSACGPGPWLRYGHLLKTAAGTQEAAAAYRKAIALGDPGEAWWGLADLKTASFAAADVAAMQRALEAADAKSRVHLHFALGRAMEARGDHAAAFAHYQAGNAGQRARQPYDAGEMTAFVRRAQEVFTPEFFAARAGHGCDAPGPIFIVGLPRSGSTLVEQMLSSHPAIEGTMELMDMVAIARTVRGGQRDYPAALAAFDVGRLGAAGESYLARTRPYRRLGRPFFVDKMPNNFIHLALIHLILPGARIIDVRRHPLDCCVSGYKQHFAAGQEFSGSLEDIGRYYADYVRLMAHFDRVLPGRVHRIFYEKLVADPEGEIRHLLAHCDLPFDEACLRFHENDRPVRTASSQQVRRPLSAAGIGAWRNYEPWLGPLKAALGPVTDAYPGPE